MLENFMLGLQTIASPSVQVMILLGALAGVIVSCLPGLGPTMTVALLIPFTFGLPPTSALLLLSGLLLTRLLQPA